MIVDVNALKQDETVCTTKGQDSSTAPSNTSASLGMVHIPYVKLKLLALLKRSDVDIDACTYTYCTSHQDREHGDCSTHYLRQIDKARGNEARSGSPRYNVVNFTTIALLTFDPIE